MDPLLPEPLPEFEYDMKIKFEPFYVELNPRQEVVKLPWIFNQQHSREISPKVMLCDPAGNMHQIGVEVRYGETYIIQGWTALANLYRLELGGWTRLVFVAADMFLIQVRDRLENPVTYPLPATLFLLRHQPREVEYPRTDLMAAHYSNVCKKPDFFHTLEKDLTKTDVTTGFLHIPVDFCQIAFRETGQKIVVFDEYRLQASCIVDFHTNHPNLSGITQGWMKFCSTKWFCEGLHVQLAVPVTNPRLMSVVVMHV